MILLNEVLRLLPESRRDNARNFAIYTQQWLPLAGNAANQRATTATNDQSDFIALRLKAIVTDTAAPPVELTAPQATLTLQIGDSSFTPDNNAIHLQALTASAGNRSGHDLEFPILIQRSTTLVGLLTNLTATAMNVRLHWFGIRVFDFAKSERTL